MVVLAYLWPLALVPLLAVRDDDDGDEVRWHARHGLVLFAAEILLFAGLWVAIALASLASLAVGCAFGLLLLGLWGGILVLHLVAILRALNGSRLLVPWVSAHADRA
jgi:hypothetical protein